MELVFCGFIFQGLSVSSHFVLFQFKHLRNFPRIEHLFVFVVVFVVFFCFFNKTSCLQPQCENHENYYLPCDVTLCVKRKKKCLRCLGFFICTFGIIVLVKGLTAGLWGINEILFVKGLKELR